MSPTAGANLGIVSACRCIWLKSPRMAAPGNSGVARWWHYIVVHGPVLSFFSGHASAAGPITEKSGVNHDIRGIKPDEASKFCQCPPEAKLPRDYSAAQTFSVTAAFLMSERRDPVDQSSTSKSRSGQPVILSRDDAGCSWSLQIPVRLAPPIFVDDIGQRDTANWPEPAHGIADRQQGI